ncbi:TetR-like C-terminal domain-containing protein, partial [Pediococcus damnosus]
FFYYLRLFSTKLDLKSSTQGIPSSLKNEFIISGLLGMIQDWLAQGMIYTPHFISTKAYELLHQKDSEKVDVSDFFVI